MPAAITRIKAFGKKNEPSIYGTITPPLVRPGGTFDMTAAPDVQMIEDNRDKTSRRSQNVATPGVAAGSFSLRHKLGKESFSSSGYLSEITTGLGAVSAGGALALGVGSDEDTLILSSGTPDGIVRIELSTGEIYIQPIHVSPVANQYTYAYPLPTLGASTVTAAKNSAPTPSGGVTFKEDPAGAITTFEIKYNQDGENKQQFGIFKGCVPEELTLSATQGERCYLGVKYKAGDYRPGELPTLTAPTGIPSTEATITGDVLPHLIECYIGDLGTVTRPTPLPINSFNINFCYEFIANLASRTRNGPIAGNYYNAASNVSDWSRGMSFVGGIELVSTDFDKTRETVDFFNNQVAVGETKAKFIHLILWFGRANQQQNGDFISIFIPTAKLMERPNEVDIDGITGQSLKFTIEEPFLVAPYNTKMWLSLFRSA